MQNSGDSMLHRLARCFGQGLALGVGFTLTQEALRPKGTRREPTFRPAAEPRPAVEPRLTAEPKPVVERPAPVAAALPARAPEPPRPTAPTPRAGLDLRSVQAIVSVVEQRIEERAGQTERRLDQLKAAASLDVQTAVARQVEGKMAEVRGQVAKTQREFAEAVARVVAQQVAQEVAKQTAAIEARVEQRIEAAVTPLQNELRELRQRLAETENTMRDFANAIGDTVRMAAEHSALSAERHRESPAHAAEAPRPATAARAPRAAHLDLRVLRQRLAAAGRPEQSPHAAMPPLVQPAAPRKQPLVVRLRAAS
jgi:hypothetical protein